MARTRSLIALGAAGMAAVIALGGCASNADPLGASVSSTAKDADAIVVGSQDYYSNEIIAEIYAEALENGGYTVQRDFRIGQREVYVPEIEAGTIDLFPEYTGPLLQFWDADATARLDTDVYDALVDVVPSGLRVLEESSATDQDAYTVTRAFAERWGLEDVGDLAKVTVPLTLGGNSEGQTRPNGPAGLKSTYGIDVSYSAIEDGGGPLTVKALKDGDIQMAIIYTADPSVEKNDLVALTDTKGLFLASHVVPVASDKVDAGAEKIINEVDAALTPEGLVALNGQSIDQQVSAAVIAKQWLKENPLD